jgi:uncharacterized protein
MKHAKRFIVALSALALLAACADKAQKRLPEASIRIKGRAIQVELARTDKEREMGLMFRKALSDGAGMLFIFDEDQQLSFWMKNTSLPLSIAYVSAAGRIEDILDMKPFCEDSVKTHHYVRYAIEVPQGYFGRIGAAAGDQVDLTAIR